MRLVLFSFVTVAALGAGVLPTAPQARAAGVVATSISAGRLGACGLTSKGGVKCWGDNALGLVSDNQSCNPTACSTPVDVPGLTSGVVKVATSDEYACALTTGGGVKCWGAPLLPNTCSPSPICKTPVDIPGLENGVSAIAAGLGHLCALTTSGGVKCLGDNVYGQLGDGQACGQTCSSLVDVQGLQSGVASIAAGERHVCAVTTAGGLKCWGQDVFGQLGDGVYPQNSCNCRTTPVDVVGLTSDVAAVTLAEFHTCALTTAGGVKCWGADGVGELGDGGACSPWCRTPVDVTSLATGVVAVSVGGLHSCALLSGTSVRCWGADASPTPIDAPGLPRGAIAVSTGLLHACALISAGGIKCWGDNREGQLGDGRACGDRCRAVNVLGLGKSPRGDANCDLGTDSVDALLVLQFSAALVPSLPCQNVADVNGDGTIDAVDAALILQYDAGLLPNL